TGYRGLMRRIFPSTNGTGWREALKKTEYRVLTFNYDRLFELALRQHFSIDLTEAFYGPTLLNSGLYQVVPQLAEVDLYRFSLLKLHGSVGVYSHERYGHCEHLHSVPDTAQPPAITDDQFFFRSDHRLRPNQPNPPLIVFPHEKDLDRKSTRLNSSHDQISYAVFCLKKKKTTHTLMTITSSTITRLFRYLHGASTLIYSNLLLATSERFHVTLKTSENNALPNEPTRL